ncbi:phage terminase large subunit family protein [Succinivibrio dextrinosolvens]|uniref:Phage terminase, large subunit GpA n=1 Tax=Succinivibrio dextrinosolvens TaxID=83771 RepID=A0A662Z7S0_9GAMM|nr:terminase gpA endonuclease subunit [Succinivibrio dextrinosolvens]SFJ74513.1 Phage terminase, large subunit GpA [Succinivibrio dextrinosolvens]
MNLFFSGLRKTLKARPRLTGSEWADQYRFIAPGTSPEPGQWRTNRVPYMKEPLDMATSHSVEKVVIMAASQVAKSELLMNVMGYYMDQEPSSIMMVQPTVENAEAFSKERIDPTIQATPALKIKMSAPASEEKGRSRKSGSTIRMKNFTGGYLAMVGSNSPSGLASRPIRVLLCDEIDRFGSTQEGDPLKLAVQRTTNFSNKKIVFVSTPTTEQRADGPTIYEEFMKSDQRGFFVTCHHCGKQFEMVWDTVHWTNDEQGYLVEDSIRMECPHCHEKVRGNGKPDPYLLESGVWIPKNPESRIKGYHLTSLCSPWVELRDLVSEWVEASHKKDKKGLQEFINLKLGEPWHEDEADLNLWEKLAQRREYYPEEGLPKEIVVLTCGVDVQSNRLEASIWGWADSFESFVICHRIMYGDPKQNEVWSQLDVLLMENFHTQDGRDLRVMCTLVDSGDGQMTDTVYQYTKAREKARVFSSKGSSVANKPIIGTPTQNNRYRANLFVLGVDAGKRLLTDRLKVIDIGPAYVHFPMSRDSGINEEYFKQLTAEVFERKFEKGRMTERWKKLRERNEALDCAVYATAAIELIRPVFLQMCAQKESVKTVQGTPVRQRKFSKGVI